MKSLLLILFSCIALAQDIELKPLNKNGLFVSGDDFKIDVLPKMSKDLSFITDRDATVNYSIREEGNLSLNIKIIQNTENSTLNRHAQYGMFKVKKGKFMVQITSDQAGSFILNLGLE